MTNWGTGFNTGYDTISHYTMQYARVNPGLASETNFWHLEQESSLRIDPITRPTSTGLAHIVAYRANLTLYIPNNLYRDLLPSIRAISDLGSIYTIHLRMAPYVHDPASEYAGFWHLGLDGTLPVVDEDKRAELLLALQLASFAIETIEARPRAIARFEAMYHKDTFHTDNINMFFAA
jgi:hypothetical protein